VGIYDRPYWREQPKAGGLGGPGRGVFFGMPRPGRGVKILLLINLAVFIFQIVLDAPRRGYPSGIMSTYLGATAGGWWQLWRYVTFQFLHAGFWHIGLNMLGLYMLGAPLEQQWGTPRFLRFYLSCGVVAGLAYVIMGWLADVDKDFPLIGASGGVYAVVLACAVLFPHFRLIFFLFPVPIRFAALVIFGGMILKVLSSVSQSHLSADFWSDVAHLGGAVGGAFWVWVLPRLTGAPWRARVKVSQGAWERKVQRQAEEQKTIDEILRKVHDQGINSLTRKEKRTLADATKRQQRDGF